MRLISDLEWSEFFESVSLVDEELRAGSDFAQMDFATRNLYRSSIEELSAALEAHGARGGARGPGRRAATATGDAGRQRDPGYHLIAAGRRAFEAVIGYRAPLWHPAGPLDQRHGAGPYVGAILLDRAIVLAAAAAGTRHARCSVAGRLALLGLARPPSRAGRGGGVRQSRGDHRAIGATVLPGLALREGVPPQLRTLVAVPTLLTTAEALEEEHRATRDPLPGLTGGRPAFRPAVGLGRRGDRTHRRRTRRWSPRQHGHRAAEPAVRARHRGRAASCFCTAGGCGATCSSSGWDGSASAASCTS